MPKWGPSLRIAKYDTVLSWQNDKAPNWLHSFFRPPGGWAKTFPKKEEMKVLIVIERQQVGEKVNPDGECS